MTETSPFHADPHARVNRPDRVAKLTWELGEGRPDFDRPTTATAQLTVRHDKDRKAFTAHVRRVDKIHTDTPGIGMEKWGSGGTAVRLTTTPVARFSQKAFEEAIDAAIAELRTKCDDPAVAAVANPGNPA